MRRTGTFLAAVFCVMAFADEQWLTTGKDPAYPGDRFFVGIGIAEKSLSVAKENAIIEVRKQISVSINATTSDNLLSVTKGRKEKFSSRTESSTRLTVSGVVEGIEIVKTASHKKNWYALAVLDKSKFESTCRLKIAEIRGQLAVLMPQVEEDIESARISAALGKLASADSLLVDLLRERAIVSAAARLPDNEALPVTKGDILSLYEKCISSLTLIKSGGDRQSIPIGRSAKNPFTLTVLAGDVPVQGIPVSLTDQNNAEVAAGYTDESGIAHLSPAGMTNVSPGHHTYTASIALAVSGNYKKMIGAQSQTFSCTAVSDPCFAKIDISVEKNLQSGKNDITKRVIALLSKYDIKADPRASSTLSIKVTIDTTGSGPGRKNRSQTIQGSVRLEIALMDEDGRTMTMVALSGTATGQKLVKAVLGGIDGITIDRKFDQLFDHLSRDKQDALKPKLNIAVSGFKVKGDETCSGCDNLAENLTTMIITHLVNMDRVTVVEREFLDRIVAERNLADMGLVGESDDEETGDYEEQRAIRKAKLAGADLLFLGTITGANEKIEIDARVVNVNEGTARCSMTSTVLQGSEARAIADDLVKQIKGKCLR